MILTPSNTPVRSRIAQAVLAGRGQIYRVSSPRVRENREKSTLRRGTRQVGDPNERLDFTQRIKNDLSNMEATGEATNSKSSYPMLRELLSKLQRLQGTPSGIDISA